MSALVGAIALLVVVLLACRQRKPAMIRSLRMPRGLCAAPPYNELASVDIEDGADQPFDVSFNELGLRLLSSKKVLQCCVSIDELTCAQVVLEGVTGELRHGQVTAIIGPSGSGKTTYLSALAGRASYGKLLGSTAINGNEVSLPRYRHSIGFVPQEDVMYRDLTVREILLFAALTKGDFDISRGDALRMVDDVMEVLGLTEIQDR